MASRNYLFLFLFSLLMTISGLAAMPPLDRDEPRFVQATKQMAETGDYVDIRFQERSRYQKPIGIYWLQSAAVALSGEEAAEAIWVYRLVSALGIAIAVVATAWTGANLFGANAGLAAGLVMAAIFATAFEGVTPRPTRCFWPAAWRRKARWRRSIRRRGGTKSSAATCHGYSG